MVGTLSLEVGTVSIAAAQTHRERALYDRKLRESSCDEQVRHDLHDMVALFDSYPQKRVGPPIPARSMGSVALAPRSGETLTSIAERSFPTIEPSSEVNRSKT